MPATRPVDHTSQLISYNKRAVKQSSSPHWDIHLIDKRLRLTLMNNRTPQSSYVHATFIHIWNIGRLLKG